MRSCAAALLLLAPSFGGGWPSGMDGFRRDWEATPVRSPRKGVWDCARVRSGDFRVLAWADSARDGSVRALDWWAEAGARDADLPDDAFWAVLDGLSAGREWTESDPDALGPVLRGMEAPAAQGFLCRSCEPPLEAATWVSHGSTHLRVALRPGSAPSNGSQPGLSPGLTAEGIRSLAAQRGLSVLSANPCREGGGDCILELSGPKGQRWSFRRSSGNSPWSFLEGSWQNGPWWSAEWNWDSIRTEGRREFADLLEQWIGADADVSARALLSPLEPALSFPVSSWFSRRLSGFRIRALADSLSRLPSPPSGLELMGSPTLRASVDGFGRRTVQVGRP